MNKDRNTSAYTQECTQRNAHPNTQAHTHICSPSCPGTFQAGSPPSTLHLHPAMAHLAFLSEATSSPAYTSNFLPREVTTAPTPTGLQLCPVTLIPRVPYWGHMGPSLPAPLPLSRPRTWLVKAECWQNSSGCSGTTVTPEAKHLPSPEGRVDVARGPGLSQGESRAVA